MSARTIAALVGVRVMLLKHEPFRLPRVGRLNRAGEPGIRAALANVVLSVDDDGSPVDHLDHPSNYQVGVIRPFVIPHANHHVFGHGVIVT